MLSGAFSAHHAITFAIDQICEEAIRVYDLGGDAAKAFEVRVERFVLLVFGVSIFAGGIGLPEFQQHVTLLGERRVRRGASGAQPFRHLSGKPRAPLRTAPAKNDESGQA